MLLRPLSALEVGGRSLTLDLAELELLARRLPEGPTAFSAAGFVMASDSSVSERELAQAETRLQQRGALTLTPAGLSLMPPFDRSVPLVFAPLLCVDVGARAANGERARSIFWSDGRFAAKAHLAEDGFCVGSPVAIAPFAKHLAEHLAPARGEHDLLLHRELFLAITVLGPHLGRPRSEVALALADGALASTDVEEALTSLEAHGVAEERDGVMSATERAAPFVAALASGETCTLSISYDIEGEATEELGLFGPAGGRVLCEPLDGGRVLLSRPGAAKLSELLADLVVAPSPA